MSQPWCILPGAAGLHSGTGLARTKRMLSLLQCAMLSCSPLLPNYTSASHLIRSLLLLGNIRLRIQEVAAKDYSSNYTQWIWREKSIHLKARPDFLFTSMSFPNSSSIMLAFKVRSPPCLFSPGYTDC